MGLSIKNDEVEASVRRLAELTGLGVTEAVHGAVKKWLSELERRPSVELERINTALAEIDAVYGALHADRFWRDDDLYDENGLPK